MTMKIMKYWIEFLLFALLFYFGFHAISLYRMEHATSASLGKITHLQQVIAELRLETVLADFNNTYHYGGSL